MQVKVERVIRKEYRIRLIQDVQSFILDYRGTQEACKWFAKMVRKAIKKHDAQKLKKYLHDKNV